MTTTDALVSEVTVNRPYRKALSAGWALSLTTSATIGALIAALPMLVAAIIWGVSGAVATVALTTALLLVFFVSGQLLDALAMKFANYRGLALIFGTWSLRFAALGTALWYFIVRDGHPVWVDRGWLFFTSIFVVCGWVAGLVRSNSRQRTLIYDEKGV